MTLITPPSRRRFLLGGLVAGGALLVGWGVQAPRQRLHTAVPLPVENGAVALNGWAVLHPDGTVSGGPMHYLRIGVAERIPNAFGRGLGKVLAAGAAVMILFFGVAGGNMFQANQTFAQLRNVTGGETGLLGSGGAAFVFGLLLAALVGAVVFGGIKSVGAVTGRLVPAMAIVYVTACLVVIAVNIAQVPTAFGLILSGAFSAEGVVGGALGAMIVGFQRAAFSNEAGLGSSPIAHSAVRTRNPATRNSAAVATPWLTM